MVKCLGAPISLSYCDGTPEDGMWVGNGSGHAVLFTVPCENWTLSKVDICGKLQSQSNTDMFVLEIWDENLDLLYSRADFSNSYFEDQMKWAEIDIPDIRVSGNVFICLFEFSNIYVGMDLDAPCFLRSALVSRNPNQIVHWDLKYPQNQTNWMISVVGYSPVPKVDLFEVVENDHVAVNTTIFDPDGNLLGATMYIIKDNEVLWSEYKSIEAVDVTETNLTFVWPNQTYWVTNGTNSVGPIFAINTIGVSSNESNYLYYSSPCMLGGETFKPKNVSALAYFGPDGTLQALVDLYGFRHYQSMELMKLTRPNLSYGDYSCYVEENATYLEGNAYLTFFKMDADKNMKPFSPLKIGRSLIHHHGIVLNKEQVDPGEYIVQLEVEDGAGNVASSDIRINSDIMYI